MACVIIAKILPEAMDIDAVILFIIFSISGLAVTYAIIRLAVCHGILDARRREADAGQQSQREPRISKIICANCGDEYDMDYPKCPSCNTPSNGT